MKKVVFFVVMALSLCPFHVCAQEDGWKNLKWGMTINEIKDLYVDEHTGEKCDNLIEGDTFMYLQDVTYELGKSISHNSIPKSVSTLICKSKTPPYETKLTSLMLYNGKLFGKKVIIDGFEHDKQLQSKVMSNLKQKYPKGSIVYDKQIVLPQYKKPKKIKLPYPYFEYSSGTIKVFNNGGIIFFYDPGMLNAVLRDVSENAKGSESKKLDKVNKLF